MFNFVNYEFMLPFECYWHIKTVINVTYLWPVMNQLSFRKTRGTLCSTWKYLNGLTWNFPFQLFSRPTLYLLLVFAKLPKKYPISVNEFCSDACFYDSSKLLFFSHLSVLICYTVAKTSIRQVNQIMSRRLNYYCYKLKSQ